MIRWIAGKLGFKRVYICAWGEYDARYDSLDAHCCRPIHPRMSVAPPHAVGEWRRI